MPTVKQFQKDPLAQNRELLNNPQVQAMLKTIRYAEGTAGERGYNTRVGYGQFDDLSKKPGKKVYIPAIKDYSSAEGAYQFLNSTWEGVSKKLGLKDFSPESQDLAAIELIKNRGALTDVLNNNLTGALSKLSKEWASLPTAEGKSAYGNQKSKKVESLANVFYGQNSNYENSVAPYMNAPQKPFTTIQIPEMQTQQVSYLDTPQETTNLAEETKTKINPQEEAFMQDLLSQMAEGVGYVEPQKSAVFQDGGTVKSDNEWLQNWYKNRVIPNKDIQGAYLEDKPIYLDRLKNIPPVTKVDMIDNNPNKTGQYNENTGELLLTPKAQPSVYTHEVNHYLNQFPSTMRTVHENIVEQNIYKKGDPRLGRNNEHYDYLRNPDEIHSRIQVLRKDAGFKPNEEVTQEKLLKYLQNYKGNDENILQIMNLTDEKGLLEMLNYMADSSNTDGKVYAKDGGVIKDNNGYWNPQNWGYNVEISSPQISMKNVSQTLLGISKESGERKIMRPENEYFFNNTKTVTEIPLTKAEENFLKDIYETS